MSLVVRLELESGLDGTESKGQGYTGIMIGHPVTHPTGSDLPEYFLRHLTYEKCSSRLL
jgi:hypothetical protein